MSFSKGDYTKYQESAARHAALFAELAGNGRNARPGRFRTLPNYPLRRADEF
jgi:hypothetical protein